jgi:hypothetical protein
MIGLVMATTSHASYHSFHNGSMDDLTVATGSGDGSRDGVLVRRSATAALEHAQIEAATAEIPE